MVFWCLQYKVQTMCKVSEGSKIEFFKNAYSNIWTKNLNSIERYEHRFVFENLNVSFLFLKI